MISFLLLLVHTLSPRSTHAYSTPYTPYSQQLHEFQDTTTLYHHHHHGRNLASPPQPPEQATGTKRILFFRLDFQEMPNADPAWFPDDRIAPWIASEVTDFYHQASYGRLHLTPLRIHPGVVRIPKQPAGQYPPNAYQYLDLIKSVVTTGSNAVPNGINAATDLVIMMWAQCEDSWLQVLYPSPQLTGCDDGSCWNSLLPTLATQYGVANDKVTMLEGGNGYFVYYVLTSQLSTTKAIANEIKDTTNSKYDAVLLQMSSLTSTTVASFNGNRQESKCSTTPAEIAALSWSGQASPTFNGNPPVFAINGFSGCEVCISGLMQHELSHALGNAPHPGAYVDYLLII